MLVYSKERFYPTLINTLVLEDANGGFWYVHRTVYDAAMTLAAKQTLEGIITLIDSKSNEEAILKWAVEAPVPLNILAPFFGLISEELPRYDIEVLAGILHSITSQIDPYTYIRQPKQIRVTIKFSLSVVNEFRMAWDSFIAQCSKPVFNQPLFGVPQYGANMGRMTEQVADRNNEVRNETVLNGESSLISVEGVPEGQEVELTVEDLKKDPNWKDLGFGSWYNEKLDQALCFDQDESDYEAEMASLMAGNMESSEAQEEAAIATINPNAGPAQSTLLSRIRSGGN